MVRDDRLYAFIIARTSRSRARIRRITVHKRWLKLTAFMTVALLCAALYGVYSLTEHIRGAQVEQENARLRAENEKQRRELQNLNQRIEAVEDTSRKLAEINGVSRNEQPALVGAGGPALPLDEATVLSRSYRLMKRLRASA